VASELLSTADDVRTLRWAKCGFNVASASTTAAALLMHKRSAIATTSASATLIVIDANRLFPRRAFSFPRSSSSRSKNATVKSRTRKAGGIVKAIISALSSRILDDITYSRRGSLMKPVVYVAEASGKTTKCEANNKTDAK